MGMESLKKLWAFFASPTAKYSVLVLAGTGLVVGIVSVIAFDFTMAATNTEEFCTSCHEMRDNPGMLLKGTTHFKNKSGVRPTCSDCHVPHEFVPKMIRKIEASREVWGKIIGKIDTPEKYAAHAPVMKAREIARLKANDSQECRNCHDVNQMLFEVQTAKAQEYHQAVKHKGKTCIDCHAGLTHTPPDQISEAELQL
jgi:cytochrome c-type protein NapC